MTSPLRSPARTARLLGAGVLAVSLAFTLTACAGDAPAADPATPASSTAVVQEAAALTITDPWIKAADSGMTAAFGTLVNSSDAEVVIVSGTTTVAPKLELHEMVTNDAGEMVMRPKKGGFVLAAGGTHELAPGGDHLMIMDITMPVLPGDEVSVTLTAEDGSEFTFTAPGRTFTGGNENYEPGAMSTPAAGGGMDATSMPTAS